MKLTDICTLDQWMELENELFKQFGFQSFVFNPEGVRITETKNSANPLCPAIKALKNGQTFICSAAHSNMTQAVKESRKAMIEGCDAGFAKWVVPVYVQDEFLGVVGGCGMVAEDEEVDTFAVNKLSGMETEEAEALAPQVPTTTLANMEAAVAHAQKQVAALVAK